MHIIEVHLVVSTHAKSIKTGTHVTRPIMYYEASLSIT